MKKILFLTLLLSSILTFSQQEQKKDTEPKEQLSSTRQPARFPECEGDIRAIQKCMSYKMQKHFAKKFNSDLPNELSLKPGKHRLGMLFTITKEGGVADIKVKAPHEKLKEECIRVIELLPAFSPATSNGEPINIKYSFAMRVEVEDTKKNWKKWEKSQKKKNKKN